MLTNKRSDPWLFVLLTATWVVASGALLTGFALLPTGQAGLASAQEAGHETFASAEEASHALFAAVQNNNVQAIIRILGAAELVSSGDELKDKRERDQFAQKYEQMHRLKQEPDGTTVLYIGAENWPFPVPLVSRQGQWFFDPDAGAQEILFRQIGENESIVIETCLALPVASGNKPTEATNTDSSVTQYARRLVSAQTAAASNDTIAPFHGYHFRKLSRGIEEGTASNSKIGGAIYLAYPVEYRSSGVMTFVVTPNGVIYEKDLGPNTETAVEAMSTWKANSNWHVLDETELKELSHR